MKQHIQAILSLCMVTGFTLASAFAETGSGTGTTATGAVGSDSMGYGERPAEEVDSEEITDRSQKRVKKAKRSPSRSGTQPRSGAPETNDDTSSMSESGGTGGTSGVNDTSATGGSSGAGSSR